MESLSNELRDALDEVHPEAVQASSAAAEQRSSGGKFKVLEVCVPARPR
jgi:hypothetical protein